MVLEPGEPACREVGRLHNPAGVSCLPELDTSEDAVQLTKIETRARYSPVHPLGLDESVRQPGGWNRQHLAAVATSHAR